MRAQSLYEARLMLRTYDFRLFMVDIQLPDGCGIDFLPEIAQRAPNASVIIVTAMRLPKYRQQAAEFGVLYYMEKPVDMLVLAGRVANLLHGRESLPAASDTAFAATLQNLSAVDVVQLKCHRSSQQKTPRPRLRVIVCFKYKRPLHAAPASRDANNDRGNQIHR